MDLRAPSLLFLTIFVLGLAGCHEEKEEEQQAVQTTPVTLEVAAAIQRNAPSSSTLPAPASANDEPAVVVSTHPAENALPDNESKFALPSLAVDASSSNTPQTVALMTCNRRPLATYAAELAWDARGKAGLDTKESLTALVAGGNFAMAIDEVEKTSDRHRPEAAMKVAEGMAHIKDWTVLDQLAGIKGADAEAIRRTALAKQLADHEDAAAAANLGKLSKFKGARSDVLEGYVALRDYEVADKFVGNAALKSDQIGGYRQLAQLLEDRDEPQRAGAFRAKADKLASKDGLTGKMLQGASGIAKGSADWMSSAATASAGKISDISRSGWSLATDRARSDKAPPKLEEVALWKKADQLEGYEKIVAAANPTERAAAARAAYDLAQKADKQNQNAAFAHVVPMLARARLGGDALNAAAAISAPRLRARTAAQLALDQSTRSTHAR